MMYLYTGLFSANTQSKTNTVSIWNGLSRVVTKGPGCLPQSPSLRSWFPAYHFWNQIRVRSMIICIYVFWLFCISPLVYGSYNTPWHIHQTSLCFPIISSLYPHLMVYIPIYSHRENPFRKVHQNIWSSREILTKITHHHLRINCPTRNHWLSISTGESTPGYCNTPWNPHHAPTHNLCNTRLLYIYIYIYFFTYHIYIYNYLNKIL